MTLNIVLTSRHALYVSADFRISHRSADGRTHTASNLEAEKLIVACKYGWFGMVTYCGRAVLPNGRPLADWISEQLELNNPQLTVRQVVDRLYTADRWLSSIRDYKRLTLIFAGFRRRRPFLYVLSNFEHPDGGPLRDTPHLVMHQVRLKDVRLSFFGDTSMINEEIMRWGRSVMALIQRDPRDPLYGHIGALNKRIAELAAASSGGTGTISPECVIGGANASGHARIVPSVLGRKGYFPMLFQRQLLAQGIVGIEAKMDGCGNKLLPEWKQTAYSFERDGIYALATEMGNVVRTIRGQAHDGRIQVFEKIASGGENRLTLTHADGSTSHITFSPGKPCREA